METDTLHVDPAKLALWIAAAGDAMALNKPRLVTNAEKYADKLTSERGLGAETAQDLALLSVDDLVAAKIPVADAKALAHLSNGHAVESGDDCNRRHWGAPVQFGSLGLHGNERSGRVASGDLQKHSRRHEIGSETVEKKVPRRAKAREAEDFGDGCIW